MKKILIYFSSRSSIIQIPTQSLHFPHTAKMRTQCSQHSGRQISVVSSAAWACSLCAKLGWDVGRPWLRKGWGWLPSQLGKLDFSSESASCWGGFLHFFWELCCTCRQASTLPARAPLGCCALGDMLLEREIFQVPSDHLSSYSESQLLQSILLLL